MLILNLTRKTRAREKKSSDLSLKLTTFVFENNTIQMGLVHAELTLTNAGDISLYEGGFIKETEIRNVTCLALVDSGAIMLAINENLKIQLGLKVRDVRPAQLADGTVKNLEIVGPIEVRFKNRMSITSAMVLPGNQEVLLGAIPMEEMDVLIHPAKQELIVNPEHPFKAQMVLK